MARKIVTKNQPDKKDKATKEKQELENVLASINLAKGELEQIESRKKELNQELVSIEENIETKNEESEKADALLFEKQNALTALNESIDEAQSLHDDVSADVAAYQTDLESYKNNAKSEKEKIDLEVAEYRNAADLEKETIKENLLTVNNEKVIAQNELDTIRDSIRGAQQSIEEKNKRFETASKELDGLLTKKREAEVALNNAIESEKTYHLLGDRIKERQESLQSISEEIILTEQKLNEVLSELETQSTELEQQKKTMVALVSKEKKLNDLSTKLTSLYKEVGIDLKI